MTAETTARYQAYLASPHWYGVRQDALARADSCYEFCGTPGTVNPEDRGRSYQLHVHHLNYDHLRNELPCDLIVLCDSCHSDVHEFPQRAQQVAEFAGRRRIAA